MPDNFSAELDARINTPVTLHLNKYQLGLVIGALENEIARTEHELLEILKEDSQDHAETAEALDDMRDTLAQLEEAFRSK